MSKLPGTNQATNRSDRQGSKPAREYRQTLRAYTMIVVIILSYFFYFVNPKLPLEMCVRPEEWAFGLFQLLFPPFYINPLYDPLVNILFLIELIKLFDGPEWVRDLHELFLESSGLFQDLSILGIDFMRRGLISLCTWLGSIPFLKTSIHLCYDLIVQALREIYGVLSGLQKEIAPLIESYVLPAGNITLEVISSTGTGANTIFKEMGINSFVGADGSANGIVELLTNPEYEDLLVLLKVVTYGILCYNTFVYLYNRFGPVIQNGYQNFLIRLKEGRRR